MDAGPLTLEEKRAMLAQIVRVNPADYMDVSGNFTVEGLRRMPAWCIQELQIDRQERAVKEGQSQGPAVVKIKVKLSDRFAAMAMDTELAEGASLPMRATFSDESAFRLKRLQSVLQGMPEHSVAEHGD